MAKPVVPKKLHFESLGEGVEYARALASQGYQRTGNWDLAATCLHLAKWISYSIDGPPPTPRFVRAMLWILRHTCGPSWLRKILTSESMPRGATTLPQSVALNGQDELAAIDELARQVARFEAFIGPFPPSLLFGMMDRPTITKLHSVHFQHHFGFLTPVGPSR